jgi:hypothetical protein
VLTALSYELVSQQEPTRLEALKWVQVLFAMAASSRKQTFLFMLIAFKMIDSKVHGDVCFLLTHRAF